MKKAILVSLTIIFGVVALFGLFLIYANTNIGFRYSDELLIDVSKKNNNTDTEIASTTAKWAPEMGANYNQDQKPEITKITASKSLMAINKYKFVLEGKHLTGFEGGVMLVFHNSKGQKFDMEVSGADYLLSGKLSFYLKDSMCEKGYSQAYKGGICEKYTEVTDGDWTVYANSWGILSNLYTIKLPR